MEQSNEKDTARIEAFSDGIFGVVATLLAIELKSPLLETVNNQHLWEGILEKWPEYLNILNSFATVLLMWMGHHSLFKLIRKANTHFMIVNGFLLLFVTMTLFSTKILSAYLLTNAANVAAAFYAFISVLVSSSYFILWKQALKDRSLLMHHLSDEAISIQTKVYAKAVFIYVVATAAAFINPWLTIGIITASWIYWIISFNNEE